ncbi:MAG: DUF1415 domain-containing protein [Myxococcota bacterium]
MTDQRTLPPPLELAQDAIAAWVEAAPVGLGLCPFAAAPWRAGRVQIDVSDGRSLERAVTDAATLGQALSKNVETALVVFPFALDDFEDFLDAIDLLETYREDAGLADTFQLASFHPEYRFEGVDADAPSNFTNRSPLPVLQWLRMDSVRAAADGSDTLAIPTRNIATVEALTPIAREGLRALPGVSIGAGGRCAATDVRVTFGSQGIASSRTYPAGTQIDPGPWALHLRSGTLERLD